MNSRCIGIALFLSVWLPLCPSLQAQQKEIKGTVKLGVHKFTLEMDTLYEFEVKAKEFIPDVTLTGGFLQNIADFKEDKTFRAVFLPVKKAEHTLVISPIPLIDGPVAAGLLDYTVTLKTMVLDEKPLVKKQDKLAATDPKYVNQDFKRNTHFKAEMVKLKAGKVYVIDMVTVRGPADTFDPFLILEAPDKSIVAQDDDGGGFPNARIVFRPMMDGEHRIIATGLSDNSDIGSYTLTVRTTKEK